MSTARASVTPRTSFSGIATLQPTPQFNSGKAEKLPNDVPVVADFESGDERVLGTFSSYRFDSLYSLETYLYDTSILNQKIFRTNIHWQKCLSITFSMIQNYKNKE